MYRKLTAAQEADFRAWARANYKPDAPISGIWHPIVQAECVAINLERASFTDDRPEAEEGAGS